MNDFEPTIEEPAIEVLEKWYEEAESHDGIVVTQATDGCKVHSYHYCQHGYPCWLLYKGWT